MSWPVGTTAGPDRVLVLCTANRARSPVMAGLLRREVALRGLDDQVSIDSAGLRAPIGEPLLPSVARLAVPMSLGLAEHRSRPLQLDHSVRPGLVLTMTESLQVGDQFRVAVGKNPIAAVYSYTNLSKLQLFYI